jgi:hypothetical protein
MCYNGQDQIGQGLIPSHEFLGKTNQVVHMSKKKNSISLMKGL